MAINSKYLGFAATLFTLVAMGQLAGCTTDENDPGAATGGMGAGTGGAGGATGGSAAMTGGSGGGSGTGKAGTVCASPFALAATMKAIADFDTYDGVTDPQMWSFPLGGDMTTSIVAGAFGYGDRTDSKFPETWEMGPGANDSKYAPRIAETLAKAFGGGLGLWISSCLDATKFTGLSFWVRGNTPVGDSTLTLSMGETTVSTPGANGLAGGCGGTMETCLHPTYLFKVTDTWTKVEVPWTAFKAGSAAGTPVTPDGRNITQIQFGVGLNWVSTDGTTYMPEPAPYELSVDSLAFY